MSFWIVPRSCFDFHTLALGDSDIHRQQDGGRGIDRHAGGDLVQRDLVEQHLHIFQGGDRNTHLAHLAHRHRVIGIVSDLGGQVEGHRKAGLALLEQVAVAVVGFFGAGITGILAHGPETPAVHGGLHAAGKGIFARKTKLFHIIRVGVRGGQDWRQGNARGSL